MTQSKAPSLRLCSVFFVGEYIIGKESETNITSPEIPVTILTLETGCWRQFKL